MIPTVDIKLKNDFLKDLPQDNLAPLAKNDSDTHKCQ